MVALRDGPGLPPGLASVQVVVGGCPGPLGLTGGECLRLHWGRPKAEAYAQYTDQASQRGRAVAFLRTLGGTNHGLRSWLFAFY